MPPRSYPRRFVLPTSARRASGLAIALVALTCALLFASGRAGAQSGPTGALDVTVWQEAASGPLQPLAGTQLVLTSATGTVTTVALTGSDGTAHIVAAPGSYSLNVSHSDFIPIASLTCGDAGWTITPTAPDGSLQEEGVTIASGGQLCREYLFAPAPPPTPPAQAAPAPATPTPSPARPAPVPQHPVYLTFDDGYVDFCETVDLVHSLGIHATFFITGQAMLAHPDCVRRLLANGDVLGNHTYAHENLTTLDYDGVIETLQRTEDAALAIAGVSTKPLCRPPYGSLDATVRAAAAAFGCRMILWDADTNDWAGASVNSIVETATSVSCNGEIVLMHTQAYPREQYAVPQIVQTLRSRGCDMIALSRS